MEVAVTTDTRSAARVNEDSWCAEQLHRNVTFLAVADGFGRVHGCNASRIALDTILDSLRRQLHAAVPPRSVTAADIRAMLAGAYGEANTRILDASEGSDDRVAAGSTCTAALIVGNQVFIAHVGDSRLYLLRRGEIVQLTSDESVVPEVVASSGASGHPDRHRSGRPLLLRVLGTDGQGAPPRVTHYTLHDGDALLLCTDGVHRALTASDVHAALQHRDQPAEWVTDRIVTLARAAGSTDDATVVLARDATVHGAPTERPLRRWELRRHLVALATACIAALAVSFAGVWTADSRLYLGSDSSGHVALFAGVPASFFGLPLHTREATYALAVGSLPAAVRDRLADGITVSTSAAAAAIVRQWQLQTRH
jgi:serine/threonine protein phosphatase PrpC